MDCAFPELLAREDILRILEQQRKISGIAELPDHELLHIFKTFAVPLAKRDARPRKPQPTLPKRTASSLIMDIDEPMQARKQMKYFHIDALGDIFCYRDKRHIDFEENLEDESLTSATKRIKIT